MATSPTSGTAPATQRYDRLKKFKEATFEAFTYGIGPKSTGPDDNATIMWKKYLEAFKEFVGGTGVDELALGTAASAFTDQMKLMIAQYHGLKDLAVLQSREFGVAQQIYDKPFNDDRYNKAVATELGINLKPEEEDSVLSQKVLNKLKGDLVDRLDP